MKTSQEILTLLEKHVNVLLYGPPGTGKSHLMKEVENLFLSKYGAENAGMRFAVDTEAERNAISELPAATAQSRWVTFHQGYSYEDFVIGLRPTASTTGGGSVLSLEAKAGALVELAASCRNGYGLMLIDEINRGNASRIFGEFITLLEPDKRLGADGLVTKSTVTVTLPYLDAKQKIEVEHGGEVMRDFQMPRNVFTLASMNSVDKSVAPLDAAIRRRFYVLQLRPTDRDVGDAAGTDTPTHLVGRLAANVLQKINRGIGLYLGPDYMLGQFYLPGNPRLGDMEESAAKKELVAIWRHKILPQLVEYFHARPAVCMKLLEFATLGGSSGLGVVSPTPEEADEGASDFIVNAEQERSEDEIYAFLEKFGALGAAGLSADTAP